MVRQPVYFSASDTAIYTIFEKLGSNNKENLIATSPASPVMLGVKLRPGLTNFYSGVVASITQSYYSFLIGDSSDAVLVAMGINPSNYKDFRYHVVENDSVELVPWSPVTDLRRDYGAKQPFGFIGQFNRPGKWITVEVCNSKNYSIREGVIFDWRIGLKPQVEQIIVGVHGNYFNLASTTSNKGYATRFDKTTNVPEDLRLPVDSIRYITFQFRKTEPRVYSAHLIRHIQGKTDTLNLGMIDRHGYFSGDPSNFNVPGKYELVFQRQTRHPAWNDSQLLRIPFEVINISPGHSLAKRSILVLAVTIFALLISFWLYRRRSGKMMQRLAQQRESAQMKLKSIHAQLNPHFIFNALSSIQNLVNKQSVNEANHYLIRFANLTRDTLHSSTQEMISLKKEWEMADNYLQMEQLRFGFSYTLTMDETLRPENIEIPPMLLQPIIENAVKHGILGKQEGSIHVSARQLDKNLYLAVEDNGRGFDTQNIKEGFGLRLSRERLDLLNSLYPETRFTLNIRSSTTGTKIVVTLTNWLL